MLDADEELLPEGCGELAACLEQEGAMAFALLRQDLSDLASLDQYAEMWQVRLLRAIGPSYGLPAECIIILSRRSRKSPRSWVWKFGDRRSG